MCWINKIESIFNSTRCSEEDKVRFAVFMLKSNALYWWNVESVAQPNVLQTMSWEEFVIRFKTQFYPRTAVRQMEEDFLKMEQGNRSVRDYTEKFIEYSQFVEHYVSSESRKVKRYILGLKPSIREFVIAMDPATFSLAVNVVEVTERNKNRQGEEKVVEKRKWEGSSANFRSSASFRRPKFIKSDNYSSKQPPARTCPRCQQVQQETVNPNRKDVTDAERQVIYQGISLYLKGVFNAIHLIIFGRTTHN
ncbi:uncharacterized protein LOC112524894 [Cynara cardunculus var. scolymus]|uniref:uncharacterized protein LOC112524894 n=1 Tax=Cynara cardunculus var. scolymus TaxID=59895 RepID=UPI000D62AD84|nr:uncharacterized protein LOC112524894 [Cynara cardunculus var. scolymus]